jgi:hypothetical protein
MYLAHGDRVCGWGLRGIGREEEVSEGDVVVCSVSVALVVHVPLRLCMVLLVCSCMCWLRGVVAVWLKDGGLWWEGGEGLYGC